jgi:ABC-type antimicrobial peptide transport system permease subunit
MNLSTARSEKRAKEVGIRKAVGSLRAQLIGQFFSESLLVVIIGFVLSLILVHFLLPVLQQRGLQANRHAPGTSPFSGFWASVSVCLPV